MIKHEMFHDALILSVCLSLTKKSFACSLVDLIIICIHCVRYPPHSSFENLISFLNNSYVSTHESDETRMPATPPSTPQNLFRKLSEIEKILKTFYFVNFHQTPVEEI
ncbi:hypothetical protein EWB00_005155 [Schistosoma japonicum]|uniref:Uncharacterized protein n=1 Tax=Schistosoma japonicum TaxID=6182 RepID=A0A4Z2D3L6_SCHJA|nr:hypothetical protein EWB00_005155 [Schistosoma japonicum]TNN10761.1 hypothetical protein EWB00_005155 [Schistosoma japonicum]